MKTKIPYLTVLFLVPLAVACGREPAPPDTDIRQSAVTMIETDRLVPADIQEGDTFGRAMDWDGDTMVVGSFGANDGGDGSGKAYIFVRDGGAWVEQARLLPDTMGTGDHFGYRVSLDGDTVAIAARGNAGENWSWAEGSVFIFERTGTTWNEVAFLEAPIPVKGGLFGVSVNLDGDTLLVGTGVQDPGYAVYVFRRDPVSGQWLPDGTINNPLPVYKDGFGFPAKLDGDLAAIAAPSRDIGEVTDVGMVYLFRRDGDGWTLEDEIVPPEPESGLNFGNDSLVLDGNTLLIGATGHDTVYSGDGAVFVYTHDGASWSLQDTLVASDPVQSAAFGQAMDLEGDRIVVGAPNGTGNAYRSGTAYVFDRSGDTWTESRRLVASDGDFNEYFGYFVSAVGDMMVVSAFGHDEGAYYGGTVFTFDLNPPPPDCPDPSEVGDGSFCSPECPCDHGEGDCDDDEDCAEGLFCLRDVGPAFGFPDPDLDVCSEICPTTGNGGGNYCSEECPCEHGEGDCDGDEDCVAGTYCKRDSGPEFGFSDPELDVCSNS